MYRTTIDKHWSYLLVHIYLYIFIECVYEWYIHLLQSKKNINNRGMYWNQLNYTQIIIKKVREKKNTETNTKQASSSKIQTHTAKLVMFGLAWSSTKVFNPLTLLYTKSITCHSINFNYIFISPDRRTCYQQENYRLETSYVNGLACNLFAVGCFFFFFSPMWPWCFKSNWKERLPLHIDSRNCWVKLVLIKGMSWIK